MITEQDKEKRKIETTERSIKICEETIQKAEKYERLKENADWNGFLKDLEVLMGLHSNEIKKGESMIADAANSGYVKMDDFGKQVYVSSKQDWVDFIVRHEIQRSQLDNWIKEPERILTLADLSRKRLAELQEELQELTHVSSTVGNGKS